MAEKKKSFKNLKDYFIGPSEDRLFLLLIYSSILMALMYNSGLPGVYITMLVYVFSRKNTKTTLTKAFKNPIVYLSSALFALYVIGLLYTDNISNGLSKLEGKIPFLIFPIFLFFIKRETWQRNFNRIVNFFLAATILATIIMYLNSILTIISTGKLQSLNHLGEPTTYHFMYTELSSVFAHPGYYTLYIAMAIYLVLFKVIKKGSSMRYWGWITYLLIFMFLLMGRGSFLAFGLILGIGFISYIIKTKKYKLIFLTVIPVIALSLFLLFAPESMSKRLTKPLNISYDISAPNLLDFNGLTVRLAEWHCATDAINNNFLIGTGPGDSQDVLNTYYKKHGFTVGESHSFNCHNQFLETQLGTGIIGSLILLSLILFISIVSLKTKNYLLLTSAWLVYLGALTESVLERQMGIYLLLFFTSFFYLSFVNNEQAEEETEEINSCLPF